MTDHILGHWPDYPEDEISVVANVLRSGKVNQWTGEQCNNFEREYAEHCGTRYALALANGTVALELALEAAGIGPGDDVIVTPRSFFSSASCVVRVGANPVFADIDADSQNITADSISAVLTNSTKAIIPVHHAGWPCDMAPIMQLADSKALLVIEDCAQAHGASYMGRAVGGIGHVGCFSFCNDKIISTAGEGGMLVTNEEALWKRAWSVKENGKDYDAVFNRDHPPGFRWQRETMGSNLRMTEIQAAIGRLQLGKLPAWTAQRELNALRLVATLTPFSCIRVPMPDDNIQHAYYRLYGLLQPDKLSAGWTLERILEAFADLKLPVSAGGCPEIYAETTFQQRQLVPQPSLPVASSMRCLGLAFAVHPTLTSTDVQIYCDGIREVMTVASAHSERIGRGQRSI